jgi:phosphoribosylglycinamide formyltransferase-1
MKIAILGSGAGSNAQAIINASDNNQIGNAEIVGIFSDKENAPILRHAKKKNIYSSISTLVKIVRSIEGKDEEVWLNEIKKVNPDLIVLAGFMKILKPKFINSAGNRIINLHPSLLPSFPGLNSIKRAFDKKVKITGCTVHWVNESIDDGEIIAQAPVRIMSGDTLELVNKRYMRLNICCCHG